MIEGPAERHLLKALNPEKVPDPCRDALLDWWKWVTEHTGKTRDDYLAEWDEGTFEW